jgi:hypothetical protein
MQLADGSRVQVRSRLAALVGLIFLQSEFERKWKHVHLADPKSAWPLMPRTDTIPEETCHRLHDGRPTTEVAMDKQASPKTFKIWYTSPEAPFTRFIQSVGTSTIPSQFHVLEDSCNHSAPDASLALRSNDERP